MKGQKTLFSKASDEWETPQDFFNELNEIYHFNLDPCASTKNAKCKKFYTKKDNGLIKSWKGRRVFCNPPYSDIPAWVKKCHEEREAQTVLLVPARTDTRWFHNFIYNDCGGHTGYWQHDVKFLRGRLKFGDSRNSAPFPSMLVYFYC